MHVAKNNLQLIRRGVYSELNQALKVLITRILLFIMLISTSGCRVGPRYEPPTTVVPAHWKNGYPEAEAEANRNPSPEYWWEIFQDPKLNELEEVAITNNPELYIALEKIFEARAMAGVVAADLYPQVTLNPSFLDYGMLIQPQIPGTIAQALGGGALPTALKPFRIHQMQYMLPLNLNWELDLWGQLRDRTDSADYFAEAQVENYLSVMLSLTADVASSYFQARTLDAEIVYLRKTIETREKNLEITTSRFNKGIVNYLDVTQARADLFSVRANLDESIRLRALAENQIAILIGMLATNFELPFNPIETPPPAIPSGVPSTVMLQRPDIAQAERMMASEHALIGAAYASFFPSLSLTGALGFSSPDISQFLKWISRFWSIGANVSQMVLDGGRNCSNLQLAYARFKEASGAYQQQVLVAFQEVENALKNIEQYVRQSENLEETVKASTQATNLSKKRYVTGVSIYLEVIENERIELQSKINWIHTLNAQYSSTIQFIKAIGGSWGKEECED